MTTVIKGYERFKLPPHEYYSIISTLSQTQGWGIKEYNIPEAWKVTQGEGEIAMVIDTGWSDHVDIGDNNIQGISTIPNVKNIDGEGHSVFCTGIICAKNNAFGMVGVAPLGKVHAVKALGDDGTGDYDSVCLALEEAIVVKPSVVSMSLGSPQSNERMHNAIKKLYEMNIPVVCAAGNEGSAGVGYPAKYPETISIAAYDKNGNIASFSSIGERVDWAAPGVDIYSTFLDNKYVIMSGTSMATPFVTGMILLLLAKHRKQEKETGLNDCRTVEQIKQHLLKYTIDKGYVGKDNYFGYGIIDCNNMIMEKNAPNLNLPTTPENNNIMTKLWRKLMYLLTSNPDYKY